MMYPQRTLEDEAMHDSMSYETDTLRAAILVSSGTMHKLVGLHEVVRSVLMHATCQHGSTRLFLETSWKRLCRPVARHLLG